MDGDQRMSSESIKVYTEKGKHYLNEAATTSNPRGTYQLAIQQFTLAHKHALLLNSDKTVQRSCLFNLGASYVAAECYRQGVDVLKTVLKLSRDLPAGSAPSRGDIFFNIGCAYERMKNYTEAIKYFENALGEYRLQASSEAMLCETLFNLGSIYYNKQEFFVAKDYFSEAATRHKRLKNHDDACSALIWKVKLLIECERFRIGKIMRTIENCKEQAQRIENKNIQSERFIKIGQFYQQLDRFDLAVDCFETALQTLPQNNRHQKAKLLLYIGESYYNQLEYQKAIPQFKNSADVFGQLGIRDAQGLCFHMVALSYAYIGEYQVSREKLLLALQAFKDSDDSNGQWQAYECLAAISIQLNQTDKAIWHFKQAIKMQGRTKEFNSAAQDRLVNRLCDVLSRKTQAEQTQLSQGSKPTDTPPSKQTPANSPNKTPPVKPAASLPSINHTDTDSPVRPTQSSHNKHYQRGRRGYEKDSDRPVHQVARGFSSLTSRSIPSPARLQQLIEEASSSSASDVSDDSESDDEKPPARAQKIIYKGRVYSLYPNKMSYAARHIRSANVAGKKWKGDVQRGRPKSTSGRLEAKSTSKVKLMLPKFEKQHEESYVTTSLVSPPVDKRRVQYSEVSNGQKVLGISAADITTEKPQVNLLTTIPDVNFESPDGKPAIVVSPELDDDNFSNKVPVEERVEQTSASVILSKPQEYSTPVQTTEVDNKVEGDTMNGTDYFNNYNHQLKEINQRESANEDSSTSSVSSTSSDESDKEELNKAALLVPASMPREAPPSPSDSGLRFSTAYEPPLPGSAPPQNPLGSDEEEPFVHYSRTTQPSSENDDTQSHIYQSIRTLKPLEPVFDTSHVYDDPPRTTQISNDNSSSDSSSSSEDGSPRKASRQTSTHTDVSDAKSFGDYGHPDNPIRSDASSDNQSTSEQRQKSKMCRIM